MEITVADLSGKHCNSAIQHHCHFLTSGQKISKSLFVPYYEVMSIYNFMSHSQNSACQKIHFDFFFLSINPIFSYFAFQAYKTIGSIGIYVVLRESCKKRVFVSWVVGGEKFPPQCSRPDLLFHIKQTRATSLSLPCPFLIVFAWDRKGNASVSIFFCCLDRP